ncbi:MAG TPA: DUF1003 domain-containing protein [Stellaceae bacterium]|nr:DUF1003 domain-containing protein [Stellaceae bacterium]
MSEHKLNWLHTEEMNLLHGLREARRRRRQEHAARLKGGVSVGERVSDAVASTVGSWRFIIIQSVILAIWMMLNVTAWIQEWDPYPFILLNLVLSFQAAYTAPVIMMSQNRQANIDREAAQHDYDVNLKAELEIELLHQKIDVMREKEIAELIAVIRTMQEQQSAAGKPAGA